MDIPDIPQEKDRGQLNIQVKIICENITFKACAIDHYDTMIR